MNQSAAKHLAKAETYLAKGEEFYVKAAAEMQSAKDAGATWVEIADALGREASWVRRIVSWAKTAANGEAAHPPFGGPAVRDRADRYAAKKVLADAPMEQIEQIVAKLPPERQSQIAAAAGSAHHKKLSEMRESVQRSDFDFDKATDLGFPPDLHEEKRKLIAKLEVIKQYLAQHGNKVVPATGPDDEDDLMRDIILDGLKADKGEIDLAFSEIGVGVSIEEGLSDLLRGS